ncbi:hypothetical protein DXG03_008102 [Asterophora parasitica]|uniref:Uncharacterized protein n=1 Tax=Asterophora parasitica TaxID=117018 RepID=A0A9P7KCX3_9AGAR|nr:hypothetical protein DXG03_008102 [Asterophora parasitica]
MWGSRSTYINVTFDATSQGQVAMVIYEWADAKYLGKSTDPTDDFLPKTYVCTTRAVAEGTCTKEQLGQFILDLPSGKLVNETSFWSVKLQLPSNKPSTNGTVAEANGFWNNPAGNPTPPASNYTSPWRRRTAPSHPPAVAARQAQEITGPDAIVPVTVNLASRAPTDVPYHPAYSGRVFFKNTFEGKLPASDYPKVNVGSNSVISLIRALNSAIQFYFAMSLIYAILAAAWAWLCYQHLQELLPIQHYLSTLVGLLVIEMVANWAYYRYLNSHGRSTASTVFLIVVAILDAARNAMSFFMLLVVSLGLSVVRESLGKTMLRCQILAGAHFIFGILYAVGIVELELESTSALILLMFVIPLAFTLSGFLLWIICILATIAQLRARKQRYKLKMFENLYYILLGAVVVMAIFFVVSSLSFSGRLAEDEIAQDEEDAEDYDLEALADRTRARDDDDNATLVASSQPGGGPGHREDVVFEIGDEEPGSDDEDDKNAKKRRLSGENHRGEEHERQGLINGGGRTRDD